MLLLSFQYSTIMQRVESAPSIKRVCNKRTYNDLLFPNVHDLCCRQTDKTSVFIRNQSRSDWIRSYLNLLHHFHNRYLSKTAEHFQLENQTERDCPVTCWHLTFQILDRESLVTNKYYTLQINYSEYRGERESQGETHVSCHVFF